jgi:hypothetical protein
VLSVAGFELAGSPAVRRAVKAVAIAVALMAGGYRIYTSGQHLMHGQLTALVDFVSTVSDILSFALIAPFLLTAIALRGGTLSWIWTLMTASLMCWLLFDATDVYGPFALSPAKVKAGCECFRLLACTLGMSAGLAQRLAVGGGRSAEPVDATPMAA